MKRNHATRLLALALAVLLLVSLAMTALANTIVGDLNGDGKVSVFDAQLLLEAQKGLRDLNTDSLSLLDIVKTILGGMPGAIDTDNDGIIEIYSASGLKQIANDPDGSYKLMNDIDMQGANWIPLAKFNGTFDGNGKTVSNMNIPFSVAGLFATNSKPINQGFFGDTGSAAVIKDLNLRNVTVAAADKAQYIGILMGTNRGLVENVTVTGTIIDDREAYEENVYIGVMAGRIADSKNLGSIIGGTSISVTDDAGKYTTDALCADVKLQVKNRDTVNKLDSSYNKIGLVGYAPKDAEVSGIWCESSNDTALLSEAVQANRKKVIDHMNTMGTVEWVPSETVHYKTTLADKTYYAGKTYYGMPYTSCNGSLEQMLAVLDDNHVTPTGLGDSYWDVAGQERTGFATVMGNTCFYAVAWAWMRVSSHSVTDNFTHTIPYHGGAFVSTTNMGIPRPEVIETRGMYPVGDWEEFWYINEDGLKVTIPYDSELAAYHCTDEQFTVDVLQNNGADTILEAYTKARGGDAIVTRARKYGAQFDVGGHARLVAADPIVIRDKDGIIDQDASYMITTEQGRSDNSNTTWRVNYKYTFRTLLDDPADPASSGYDRTYLPITIRALHDESVRASYVSLYPGDENVTAPNKGKIYSNFRVLSHRMIVKDGETVVYDNTIYTTDVNTGRVSYHQTINMNTHNEAFLAAAAEAGLVEGETYTFSLDVVTADGKLFHRIQDKAFTYTVQEEAESAA